MSNLSGQFHGRFLIQCQNTRIDFSKLFTRHLQRLVKFWHRRKKWEFDSASKLWEQSGFTVSWKYCLNLCSLRGLATKKFTQIYLRLPVFGKCLKWVFQVWLRRFPVGRDALEVKKIIKVKFLWIKAATDGRLYEWVNVFWKTPTGCFSWYLEFGCGP